MQQKSQNAGLGRVSPVRKVRIDSEQADQRIDNFLRRELPGVPKGRLYRLIRKGEVRVNGKRVKAEYRLEEGDEVRVPPVRLADPATPPSTASAAAMSGTCALRGQEPARRQQAGWRRRARRQRHQPRRDRAAARGQAGTQGPCARASARSRDVRLPRAGEKAQRAAFTAREISRGQSSRRTTSRSSWATGNTASSLSTSPLVTHRRKGERHVVVSGDGKSAQTRVRLARTYKTLSLVQCSPLTGRTHQIRVHLQQRGPSGCGRRALWRSRREPQA